MVEGLDLDVQMHAERYEVGSELRPRDIQPDIPLRFAFVNAWFKTEVLMAAL
jgi:hypothetical protein